MHGPYLPAACHQLLLVVCLPPHLRRTLPHTRLRMVAIFFGLVTSSHFAAILIPVSSDSKLWSAVGIPFERAVLYHVIIGHLAFASLLLHAVLFVIFWVWFNGWEHAWHESTRLDPNIR